MAKRQGITKKTRFEVFKRDSFICQYCGQSAPQVVLHVDHIQPVSKDGTNDMLNLITSCDTCNAGKSDNLLSDDSAVRKQKAQLDELNERREQIEMMLEWRTGLQNIDAISLDAVQTALTKMTKGSTCSPFGKQHIKKLIREFGLSAVLDAVELVEVYLVFDPNEPTGKPTLESMNHAFDKLGGVCRLRSLPEWKQEIYYIRNIARSRMRYCSNQGAALLLQQLENAFHSGISLDILRTLALGGYSGRELDAELQYLMEEQNAKSA